MSLELRPIEDAFADKQPIEQQLTHEGQIVVEHRHTVMVDGALRAALEVRQVGPTKPAKPSPAPSSADAHPAAAALTATQLQQYSLDLLVWQEELKDYRKKSKAITEIEDHLIRRLRIAEFHRFRREGPGRSRNGGRGTHDR